MNKRELTALIASAPDSEKGRSHDATSYDRLHFRGYTRRGTGDVHGIRFLLYPRARPANKLQRVLERTTTP